jgi:hypothetical protein
MPRQEKGLFTLEGRPLNFSQQNNIYNTVERIIDGLDVGAMKELSGGMTSDIDELFDTLVKETVKVLNSDHTHLNVGSFGYLDRFTDSVEETLRCSSLNYFISSVLPDFILGWHNLEWGNLVQMNRLLCILAARDHGKSYEFSFAYPLWQMYRYRKYDSLGKLAPKEFRMAREGMLVTNEYGLAAHFLRMIKEEIENNDILSQRLLPDSKVQGWGNERITAKNGAEMYIKSAGSKIRGHHPTWIAMDDFLNESSLYSQDQRDKYWNIFSAVIFPALSPGGQLVMVGTPFFEKDLYGTLKEKGAAEKGADLFKIFEYPAIFPDGTLLFPERHTYESIMQKQALLGSLIFSREILVKPISDGATIFGWSILRNSIKGQQEVKLVRNIDEAKRKFIRVSVGCDFAISSSIGADYSCFTILGQDEYGQIHFLNTWRRAGASYSQQMAALKKINRDFRPDVFVVETNGMQEIFLQEMEAAGLPVVGQVTGVNKKSFYKGVPALAILFETSKIKFPYGDERSKNITDLYHSELNSITFLTDSGKLESTTQHDDCGMSLWQGVKGLKWGVDKFDFSFIG